MKQEKRPPQKQQSGKQAPRPQDAKKHRRPAAKAVPYPKPGEPCPYMRKCGGCQMQNMSYERQLNWKYGQVKNLLGRFAEAEPAIGMDEPYYYRNKVQAAFGCDRNGKIICGVYQSSTHRIVPVEGCLTEDREAGAIIRTIRDLMEPLRIAAYDEYAGKGFLRHVLVKRGFESGQIMVVLVTATPIFPAKKYFLEALRKAHPNITTVLMSVNKRFTSMVLGEDARVLFGPGKIEETLCGCRFMISAKSFYQINPVQTQVLYETAMAYAGLDGKPKPDLRVVDAYCGVGTIGIVASKYGAGSVFGIEQNKDAVWDAVENAKRNQVSQVFFRQGDAGEELEAMAKQNVPVGVVFMDPPRAGSSRQFLDALARLAPAKIIYISCNPETQARDLAYLTQKGFAVKKIQPVDMFPFTRHVETIVGLQRRDM